MHGSCRSGSSETCSAKTSCFTQTQQASFLSDETMGLHISQPVGFWYAKYLFATYILYKERSNTYVWFLFWLLFCCTRKSFTSWCLRTSEQLTRQPNQHVFFTCDSQHRKTTTENHLLCSFPGIHITERTHADVRCSLDFAEGWFGEGHRCLQEVNSGAALWRQSWFCIHISWY